MTRTVRDNAILLQAIAGHDAADPASASAPVPDYQHLIGQPAAGIRVGVVQAADDDEVQPDVRRETDNAVHALQDAGYTIIPVSLPYPVQALRALLALLYVEASTAHAPWLRTHRDQYSQNTLDRLELGALLPGTIYVRAQRIRRLVNDAYRQLFSQVDLLATPVAPVASYRLKDTPARPVLETGDRFKTLCRFSGPFNLIGAPAISVPCGFGDDGLPIGLQLVAPPFSEPVLYQAGAALEQQIGRFGKVVAT
jgi:aspartyl-tRNA(Asn)/glutamyl-tRNA(Gln) amidotransferase subunit A